MFTTGTATDYHDLLDDLRVWLTVTVGWTQLEWNAPVGLTSNAELFIRGPGAGAGKQPFVIIRSENDVPNGAYGWAIRGATGYDSGLAWDAQPGGSQSTYMNTWTSSIDYWFYANDRRIIVMAKVNSNYVGFYAGFGLPFATPDEYPTPMLILGTRGILAPYNEDNCGNRMFVDPGRFGGAYFRRATETWRNIGNHYDTIGFSSDAYYGTANAYTWPCRPVRVESTNPSTCWTQLQGFHRMRPNANGEMPLFAIHIIDPEIEELPMVIDSCYVTGGFGRTAEGTVTISSRTFRFFPNVFRTTGRDFFAIEEL